MSRNHLRIELAGERGDLQMRDLRRRRAHEARAPLPFEFSTASSQFRLRVAGNAAFDHWAALSAGAYPLRSNITDWTDQQLWKAYIQLTQAEAAFRIQKHQLNVRPIWHF